MAAYEPQPEAVESHWATTLSYLVTALTFFILGLMVAIFFDLGVKDDSGTQETVAQAIAGTLVALTPSPTPSPTIVPVQLTFSEERDYERGDPDAPIIVVEFSDYQCPYCGRFALQTLTPLLEEYGDLVRFVYRDYPILGEASLLAAHAAQCADRQDRFWDYHDMLFLGRNQADPIPFTAQNLVMFAGELGLDTDAFEACMADPSILQDVTQNLFDGQALLGGTGTPTFLINGRRLVGAYPLEVFIQVIDEELALLGIERSAN